MLRFTAKCAHPLMPIFYILISLVSSIGHPLGGCNYINASKCKVLTVTLKRQLIDNRYVIGGEVLEHVTSMRDLGVIIDQKLTFEPHIDSVARKANGALGLLIRSLQAGCRGTRYQTRAVVAAYCANVRSILEYGSVIWGGAARTHTDRIERVQHKFLMWLAAHSFGAPQNFDYNRLLSHFPFAL